MNEVKTRKCPNCGAPVSGSICHYCGQQFEETSGQSADETVEVIRPKRNVLDVILIVFGSLWVFITIAAAIELRYYHPAEMAAIVLLASPGIVLLLIGFRRKKTVILKGTLSKNRKKLK